MRLQHLCNTQLTPIAIHSRSVRSRDRPPTGESAEFKGGAPFVEQGLHLSEHAHAGHIYAHRDEQVGVAASFFRAGLHEQLRCVYVHDEADDARALQSLARAGLDVNWAIQSAALELAGRQLLPVQPGSFDVEAVFAFARVQIAQAEAAGYKGVRGVGDMGCVLAPDLGHARLSQYETECTGFLNANPVSAICQYDRGRFDDGALYDVVCEHPLLIVGGLACRNPYYVPAIAFAEREQGTTDIDQLLGKVLAHERLERWLAVAEVGLEAHDPSLPTVELRYLAGIYEHMSDYKQSLRERLRWRLDRQPGGRQPAAVRTELTALDAEIQWLEGRASLWRRRELQSSGLYFEPASGTVAYRGAAVGLSRLEAGLFRVLLEQAGRPCSAPELMRAAWDGGARAEAQLRNYIVRLRGKLEVLNIPASIVTQRGRGYCLRTGEGSRRA